jgi:broad specificity phosphatase PhoE
MTSITLIRHGETVYNADTNNLLVVDAPLIPFGCLQASLLTGSYDVVFISPLLRTQQTFDNSQIIGKRIVHDARLRECDLLKGELSTKESLNLRCQDFY